MSELSFAQHLAHYLRDQWAYLKIHEPIARDGRDPTGVHQMRVTTRRLRSLLSAAKFLYPDKATKPLRKKLKALAAVLGPVRDLDVLLVSLADRSPEVSSVLKTARDDAHEKLVAYLDSAANANLNSEAESFFAQPAPSEISSGGAEQKLIPPLVNSVVEAGNQIDPQSATDDELHRLRIQFKKLRYLAELFALGPLALASATLTSHLGQHQDACVEIEALQNLVPDSPSLIEVPNRIRLRLRGTFAGAWQKFLSIAN